MNQPDQLPAREVFEAWFADSRRNRGAKHRPNFDTLSDGTYADDHTQRHWWTWQQARDAERARADALQAEREELAELASLADKAAAQIQARADALEAALLRLVWAIDDVGADDTGSEETLSEWYDAKEAARALLEKPQ